MKYSTTSASRLPMVLVLLSIALVGLTGHTTTSFVVHALEVLPPHAYINRSVYPRLAPFQRLYSHRRLLPQFSMMLVSDIQYAEREEEKRRHFKMSAKKLQYAVTEVLVNRSSYMDLIVNLGDLVDSNIELNGPPLLKILDQFGGKKATDSLQSRRGGDSAAVKRPIATTVQEESGSRLFRPQATAADQEGGGDQSSKPAIPVRSVLGNHDFLGLDEHKWDVALPKILHMPARYFYEDFPVRRKPPPTVTAFDSTLPDKETDIMLSPAPFSSMAASVVDGAAADGEVPSGKTKTNNNNKKQPLAVSREQQSAQYDVLWKGGQAPRTEKFRVFFLDGSDLSYYGTSAVHTSKRAEMDAMFAGLKRQRARNANKFNGGIGKDQLLWLERELNATCGMDVSSDAAKVDTSDDRTTIGRPPASKRKGGKRDNREGDIEQQESQDEYYRRLIQRATTTKVIIALHHPLRPTNEPTTLWNHLVLVHFLARYPCVVAVFNGHAHKFLYDVHRTRYRKLHFVTFGGMVQSPFTSFAFADFYEEELHVHGLVFGREEELRLSTQVGDLMLPPFDASKERERVVGNPTSKRQRPNTPDGQHQQRDDEDDQHHRPLKVVLPPAGSSSKRPGGAPPSSDRPFDEPDHHVPAAEDSTDGATKVVTGIALLMLSGVALFVCSIRRRLRC